MGVKSLLALDIPKCSPLGAGFLPSKWQQLPANVSLTLLQTLPAATRATVPALTPFVWIIYWRWTPWAHRAQRVFLSTNKDPRDVLEEKISEKNHVRHFIGFRLLPPATLGYLFPGKRQLRFFWKSLLALVTGGRIIVVYVLETREGELGYLALCASLSYL